MDWDLREKVARYASHRGLAIGPSLGRGVHGIVFRARFHQNPAEIAVKFHGEVQPFHREVAAYDRLAEHGVLDILGFHVPQVLKVADDFLAIEMTIVARPFALDFAAAYLDRAPQFSTEVMADWEAEKREQFGSRWPTVQRVLTELRSMGIHQTDVSPGNIGFA